MSLQIIAEIAQGFEGCPDQARLLLKAAAAGGAAWVTPCDTNGGTLPGQVATIIVAVLTSG